MPVVFLKAKDFNMSHESMTEPKFTFKDIIYIVAICASVLSQYFLSRADIQVIKNDLEYLKQEQAADGRKLETLEKTVIDIKVDRAIDKMNRDRDNRREN